MHHSHEIIQNDPHEGFYNLWKNYSSSIDDVNDQNKFTDESQYTYGYLKPKGVAKLIDEYTKHSENHAYPSHFLDIGSGLGMPNIIMVVLVPHLSSSNGIELSTERYKISQKVKRDLNIHYRKKLHFYNQNMLKYPYYQHADMIWISNLCLSDKINEELSELLRYYVKPKTQIFTSKPLIVHSRYLINKFEAQQSWNDTSIIYHYLFVHE
uniref:DOT1 domain-containing protein n=1 Tax=viral metagenome TaxID=1070528 RepID=A0A6C0CSL7_9ZZZZ